MKPELAEYLSQETVAHVLIAVDREGKTFGTGSEVPLVVSMMAAKGQVDVFPQDVLTTIRTLESLTQVRKEYAPAAKRRGRKPKISEEENKQQEKNSAKSETPRPDMPKASAAPQPSKA